MNTAGGSTTLLRQHGPNGTMWFRIMLKTFKTNHKDCHHFAFYLFFFSIPVPVVVHPPPWIESRDSIKTLRDWRFDLPVAMATVASSQIQFLFNLSTPTTILSCVFSVLKCPRRFCTSALTSETLKWMTCKDAETERWREAGQSASVSGCIHIMQTVEEPVLTPDSTAGGRESLIRRENSPAPLQQRVKDVLYNTAFRDPKT